MTYNKPEVLVLGDASQVIQTTCSPKGSPTADGSACGTGSTHAATAAYDLDE